MKAAEQLTQNKELTPVDETWVYRIYPHLGDVELDHVVGLVGVRDCDGHDDGLGLEELGHVKEHREEDDRHQVLEEALPDALGVVHGLVVVQGVVNRDVPEKKQNTMNGGSGKKFTTPVQEVMRLSLSIRIFLVQQVIK